MLYDDDGTNPHSFCDNYAIHDPHSYLALNGNIYVCPGFDAEDLAELIERESQPPCEHGLSAHLCAGPGHYPMDRDEEYF